MRTNLPVRLFTMLALAGTAALAIPLAPALAASGDAMMFKLDAVNFVGNQRVTTDKLNSVVGIAPGDKINRDSVVQAFANVQAEYQKENVGGTIQPEMTLPKPGHMVVTFQISELAAAAPVVVPLVLDHETFTGNVKIPSAQLQPSLTIQPGSTVNRDLIIADMNSISKVYKGANQGVGITPKITYPTPGHVDLNFELNENPPGK